MIPHKRRRKQQQQQQQQQQQKHWIDLISTKLWYDEALLLIMIDW